MSTGSGGKGERKANAFPPSYRGSENFMPATRSCKGVFHLDLLLTAAFPILLMLMCRSTIVGSACDRHTVSTIIAMARAF